MDHEWLAMGYSMGIPNVSRMNIQKDAENPR